jgi:DNA-binding beta-propeller fold protein YncE
MRCIHAKTPKFHPGMLYSNIRSFFACYLLLGLFSCEEKNKNPASGPGEEIVTEEKNAAAGSSYLPGNPEIRELDNTLKEISGIFYLKDGLFAAVQDEKGTIYTVDQGNGSIVGEINFAAPGDYEDITAYGDFYYVLRSDGTIYKVPKQGEASGTAVYTGPGGKMEFETLYLDETKKKLVLICKECGGKKNDRSISAFSFDLSTGKFDEGPFFVLDLQEPANGAPGKNGKLKPSAAAIHPVENKLYVLCSVGSTLLVCDLRGKTEFAWPLDPGIYKQPEGLAFAPNGDMYLSNEAAKKNGKGNIMKLVYKPV